MYSPWTSVSSKQSRKYGNKLKLFKLPEIRGRGENMKKIEVYFGNDQMSNSLGHLVDRSCKVNVGLLNDCDMPVPRDEEIILSFPFMHLVFA
jgi:hypothetical protein